MVAEAEEVERENGREREREDLRLAGDKECGEARTCGGWQEGGRAGVAVTVKTKKGGGERERERAREREREREREGEKERGR